MSVRLVIMDPIDSTEKGPVILIEIAFYPVRYLFYYLKHRRYEIDYEVLEL